jgi:hypothetical protein
MGPLLIEDTLNKPIDNTQTAKTHDATAALQSLIASACSPAP